MKLALSLAALLLTTQAKAVILYDVFFIGPNPTIYQDMKCTWGYSSSNDRLIWNYLNYTCRDYEFGAFDHGQAGSMTITSTPTQNVVVFNHGCPAGTWKVQVDINAHRIYPSQQPPEWNVYQKYKTRNIICLC